MSKVKIRVKLKKIDIEKINRFDSNYRTMPIQHFIFNISLFATNILDNLTIVKVKRIELCPPEYIITLKAKNSKESIKTFLVAVFGEREEIYSYYNIEEIY